MFRGQNIKEQRTVEHFSAYTLAESKVSSVMASAKVDTDAEKYISRNTTLMPHKYTVLVELCIVHACAVR